MTNIYNKTNIQKVAVLEHAFNIEETEILNNVSEYKFSMPSTDPKLEYCKEFNYVRWEDNGALYRLLDDDNDETEESEIKTFICEHVIATLIDDVIFQTLELNNLTTKQVIENILNRQTVKRWKLGVCEFDRRFSYSWSNENLLTALFSIPNRFDIDYKWEFDTTSYPWTINLRTLAENRMPEFYIRVGKNAIRRYETSKGSNVCTVLYPLGFGEGINQLTVSGINGGKPYIEASREAMSEYGRISRIWEDLRFEVAEHLLERAEVILDKLSKPYKTYEFTSANIEDLSGDKIDRAESGKIISFDGYKTYIVKVKRYLDDIKPYDLQVANQPEDVATSISDLANRQRISNVYAQGSTSLYSQAFNDNADSTHPAVIKFYIPNEARNINKVILNWELERFRGYTKSAASGGGASRSTSEGGKTTRTSSSGGSSIYTSSGGGASTNTSSSGGGSTSTSSSGGGGTSSSGGGVNKSTASGGGAATSTASGGAATNTKFGSGQGNRIKCLKQREQHWKQHYGLSAYPIQYVNN